MKHRIPSQRVSTENLPHCDHEVCNTKGGGLTVDDLDFVIRCLQDQQIIVQNGEGKYELGGDSRAPYFD